MGFVQKCKSQAVLTVSAVLHKCLPYHTRVLCVQDVPFLEPLSAMCDVGLPLTVKERREWGDPLAHEVRYIT